MGMNLFSGELDTNVDSPAMKEYEAIKKQLEAKVNAAEAALANARADLYKHLKSKDAYMEAGRKQLSIFDV